MTMWRHYQLCVMFCVLYGVEAHLNSICAQSDREEVAAYWTTLWSPQYQGRKSSLASAVFKRMFSSHPEVQKHFPLMNMTQINSPAFRGHAVRIIHGFDIPITYLMTNYEVLEVQLKYLGKQHTHYDPIEPEAFKIMRDSFEDVLAQVIPDFMPYAWRRCITVIQEKIMSTMYTLAASSK